MYAVMALDVRHRLVNVFLWQLFLDGLYKKTFYSSVVLVFGWILWYIFSSELCMTLEH